MALSMNKAFIAGNLGADPDVREAGQKQVCEIRVATSERWGQGREAQERTEWHRVVIWDENNIAFAEKFLRKGDPVIVEGRIQTRKWTDKDGVERYTTEIVAQRVQGVPTRGDDDRGGRDRRDERSNGRDDRDRGGARDTRGRDDRDRGASRSSGRDDDRGRGYGARGNGSDSADRREERPRDERPRDDRSAGGGYVPRSGGTAGAPDLDDEIPFAKQWQ